MKKLQFLSLIISIFLWACVSKKETTTEQTENITTEETLPRGQVLIESSDCQTCHHTKNKLIGPSYEAVALRDANVDTAQTYLARKIIVGGSGVWGDIAMLPHNDISEEDAREMAAYILSFKVN